MSTALPPYLDEPTTHVGVSHRRRNQLSSGWRSLLGGGDDQPPWVRPALLVLLLGTGVLYFWNLSASGYANDFYAAAVQAGTKDWTALLFGSLDPGNAITVDKPPASLWVMDLSARIFGFSSWSVLAPQALEGVLSVWLTYATVKRWSSPAAGLFAGAALALTPVAVLMFRFNNPDALLVLLMCAGAYCTVRATEKASWKWLMLAGVAIGFAFLTKMMQGFLVLPAFALVYLVAAPTGLGKRILHLLGAGLALVISAGWLLVVEAVWPASARPFIGGSTNNSLLELALGYNGVSRILGGSGNGPRGGGGGPGGGGNVNFGGATGIDRMFGAAFGTEISWLLPAALIGLLAGLWLRRNAPRTDRTRAALLLWGGWLLVTGLVFSFMSGTIHPYYAVTLAPAIAALVGIAGRELWRGRDHVGARVALAVMVAVNGYWDYVLLASDSSWVPALRYIVLFVSILSAIGIGVGTQRLAKVGVVIIASAIFAGLLGSTAWATATAAIPHSGAVPVSGPSGGIGDGPGGKGGAPGGMRGRPGGGQFPGGPGGGPGGGQFPGGPGGGPGGGQFPGGPGRGPGGRPGGGQFPGGPGGGPGGRPGGGQFPGGPGGGPGGGQPNSQLTALLKAASSYRWAAAIIKDQSAASLELASGSSVMAIGGWYGSDPSPTLAQFEAYVKAGDIHYFIAGGGGMDGGPGGGSSSASSGSSITSWVQSHYQSVTVGGSTVYDLTKPTSTS